MRSIYVGMIVLVSASAIASAESPPIAETWQQVEHAVIVEDEGAAPYIEFVIGGATFYPSEYTEGDDCRGGSYEDLVAVLNSDSDGIARMRAMQGNEEICPNSIYVCLDPDQNGMGDEPAGDALGFCGPIVIPSDE